MKETVSYQKKKKKSDLSVKVPFAGTRLMLEVTTA